MHIFDPNRKRLGNGKPCIIDHPCVVSGLDVYPDESWEDGVVIWVNLPSRTNTSGRMYFRAGVNELPRLLRELRNNPEEFFANYFGWRPEPLRPQRAAGISLEDLGL